MQNTKIPHPNPLPLLREREPTKLSPPWTWRVRHCAAVATLLLAIGGSAHADSPDFPEASYRKHIEVLSSDAFEGRAPGTDGEKKTLDYIEQQFRAAGLKPGIGNSYLQPVPVVEIMPHADATMQLAGSNGQSFALRSPDDVVVWTKRPVPSTSIANAEVVYAGYGIVAPEYGWDDYAGLDVRGKLVLALVNDPGFATQDPKLFTGNAMTYYGRWDYKFAEAVRRGAAGMLVIHETKAAGYPWDVPRNGATKPQFDLRIDDYATKRLALEGWITEDAASRVLSAAGLDFAALKKAASTQGFKGKSTGVTASMSVRNDVRNAVSYNVVGMVPAASARMEAFVYTAHWDHLGQTPHAEAGRRRDLQWRAGQRYGCIGADRTRTRVRRDEASTGTLGDVRRRHRRGIGVARQRVLRCASTHPGGADGGGLNMDNLYSVGKTRDITVIGFGKSELEDDLRAAAARQGRVPAQEPSPEKGFYYRSDHFNLAKVGVPMLYTKAGIDSPTQGADYGKRWLEDVHREEISQGVGRVFAGLGRERHAAGPAAVLRGRARHRELVTVAELAGRQRIPGDPGPEPEVAVTPSAQ